LHLRVFFNLFEVDIFKTFHYGAFMKKIVFVFAFLLTISFQLNAQWFWQNPLPQGNTLNSVDFIDANKGGLLVLLVQYSKPQTVEQTGHCNQAEQQYV
jgi:hypothetical protein